MAVSKKLVFGLALACAPVVIVCGAVAFPLVSGLASEYVNRLPFDPAAWKGADLADGRNPARLRMVDDLLRRHRLVGMAQAEVDELLGVPPRTGYFRDYDYVYWLGPERGFISIDSEWLVLKFEQGRVARARIVRD